MNTLMEALRSLGRADALALRERAADMTGTEIIAAEHCIPAFDPAKDYSAWPAGSPVADGGQVWTLLQPHNAADYTGSPATLRALWSLCHTMDPNRAKPWADPFGASGIYRMGECYRDDAGVVWRCKQDNTVHDAAALPEAWEEVAA